MYTIAVFVGSLRKESFNKKLAQALMDLGKDQFTFSVVALDDVPMYNQDLENDLPAPVARIKKQAAEADGVLFVTPEYNRSIPGVLKNVLDWGSRPMGANVWAGKPAAMTGTSEGSIGTAVAQSQLRSILGFLGMRLTVQPELYFQYRPGLIADDGSVTDEKTLKYLQRFLSAFKDWINELKA